ncbi:glycosyl transferase, group 1 family protein (plasmid) [Rhodovulum sp. P5]|uniref:glycosyltransferase family 4 protein n=1 Tax=Rhodovulum sp. P5 TaxID=1564506 RepID=UPI0009C21F0C|nr:glycosyltransferase family 4 protein [Rhodovulum sp. P5]ARE42521.1 glycosyl transferase, group 1 family protein [Rhodovulum sp. P5]
MTETPRPRVLVIAEAANPEWVSVPLVGWSLAAALRQVADVHIVTQIRNRDAFLRAGLVEGQDFTAIDSDAVARPFWRLAKLLRGGTGTGWTINTAMASLSYFYFEHLLWRRFGPDIGAGRYDIVHRVTPLGPTSVSPVAAKCAAAGVPFVMGPINGGVPWPAGFDAERRREREWLSYVRGIYKMLPGRRRMLRAAAAIIAGSHHTAGEYPRACRDRIVYIPENAIAPERFNLVAEQRPDGPLRGCFIGRLVPYKGPDMALEAALPLLAAGHMTLDIIGDGPLRQGLEDMVRDNGLDGAVTFHGNLPHTEVQKVAVQSHLLVFPSIREFGGGVVLEAMALGVVPVVADYAGPGELVTDDTGIRIPIATRAETVSRFRDRLEALARDRTALPAMAAAARARIASHFTWARKAEQVCKVYDWVLSGRPAPPPRFF